ncbi:ROK family transcriptional regulator [Salinispira pacifica]|uniref:Xylose-responsive transcription regulator, ROK family n=1 Tax=Salinispira pacifica TaxID=1307761 RepID=V5WE70_9SPIO|nr:ROK family transcriptional regulator [Salinispira pacifica]AHC13935.1 Xylose-responsive transcription regulator, ROK family [Salinispira pacifica]
MEQYARGEKTSYNYYKVLRSIWLRHGISRMELCELLGLDKATISTIVNSLIHQDMVYEVPRSAHASKPGRRPVGLSVNPEFGCAVGIELHRDGLHCVVTDMHHREILTRSLTARLEPENIQGLVRQLLDELQADNGIEPHQILGLGVSVPGVVNQKAGLISHASELDIRDTAFNFRSDVEKALGISCMLSNDANACASGILTSHRSEAYSNFLFVYFSFESLRDTIQGENDHLSVGLGIVINGALYDGPNGTAGEFVGMGGGSPRRGQFSLSSRELDSFKENYEVRRKFLHELSEHIGFLVNVFNFTQVFIGGDLEYFEDNIAELTLAAANAHWPFQTPVDCNVTILKEQRHLPARGAAGMLLDSFFSVPGFEDSGYFDLRSRLFRRREQGSTGNSNGAQSNGGQSNGRQGHGGRNGV